MPVRRRAAAFAVLATTALTPVAIAQAAKVPTIDVWSGKTHKKSDITTIYNERGTKAVPVSVTVNCVSTTGAKQQITLSATGKLANGKVDVTNKKADGVGGTLTVKAKLPTTRAATGTVSWKLAASNAIAACEGSDTFKLKHTISHGG
ncbi:hypothetical protein DSM104299_01747 [Baekduia alba]|uniref:hypothetical protein n=1 Tax=Baekduia alba TaxID=2997333 RepID=UPI00234232E0|nr:hypothetical protein [Baekduia alba]WCB93045.1 hypothetical protein DSM104299_01747 [Baekduia alba]